MTSGATNTDHPVKGIDHCFALVDDLDAAAVQFRALGFTLSERGLHSKAKGSANYTIMFPADYFELLGLIAATPGNAARRQSLVDKGQGLHAIACRIDDVTGADAALSAHGLATLDVSHFERPVPLPDGTTGRAAFSTLPYAPEVVPRGIVFMCQHKTRETVWLPGLLEHPNTACGLDAVLAVSDDPAGEAARFARLWAGGAVRVEPDGVVVETGPASAALILKTQAQMQAMYPAADLSRTAQGMFTALRIKVSDLNAAAACLARAEVTAATTERGLMVHPADAAGTVIEFAAL